MNTIYISYSYFKNKNPTQNIFLAEPKNIKNKFRVHTPKRKKPFLGPALSPFLYESLFSKYELRLSIIFI